MKVLLISILFGVIVSGCASHDAAAPTALSDGIREHGTTGLGVGSDTQTQTGIDSGTRSGSGITPQ